jgi:uncharacterized membrane protein (UPF0127 family)
MKKIAWPGPIGSIEEYGDGIGAPKNEPTDIEQDSSEPFDTMVIEKSVLEDAEPATEYAGGIISPVEGDGQDSFWADPPQTSIATNVTVYKSAATPLASFQCNVAESVQEKMIGLQSYKGLGSSAGLLFKYRRPEDVMYHMGTVSFPIDIIFVGANQEIKRIYPNIQPGSLATFGCSGVKYVLEIFGGLSEQLGIRVGQSLEIEAPSEFQKEAAAIASKAGFKKNPVIVHNKLRKNGALNWNNFPIINTLLSLDKTASKKMTLNSGLTVISPIKKQIVTAFFLDGIISSAPYVKYYGHYQEVDDSWSGKISTGTCGRTLALGKGKIRDAREEAPQGKDALTRESFEQFLNIQGNKFYNEEIDKFLMSIKSAKDAGNQLVFCTSVRNPQNLVNMLQHKLSYRFGESVDLESANILCVSKEADAHNMISYIQERYPAGKIEIRSDSSITRRAGIAVPDDVKRKGKEAIKALDRASELVDASLERMIKNKIEYEKHQDNAEAIAKTKGQFHQATKRQTTLIKNYLIKLRDTIKILNEIKDITTTLEIIDGLVSSSKAASDSAEEVFNMIDKISSPDFFIEYSGLVNGYDKSIEDLLASIERAKEYINSNILGIIVLSE